MCGGLGKHGHEFLQYQNLINLQILILSKTAIFLIQAAQIKQLF